MHAISYKIAHFPLTFNIPLQCIVYYVFLILVAAHECFPHLAFISIHVSSNELPTMVFVLEI